MKKATLLLTAGFALTTIHACKDPSKSAPAAEVAHDAHHEGHEGEHKDDHTADAKMMEGAVKLTSTHGKIGFVGSKVTGSHEGVFENFEGSVFVDEAKDLTAMKVSVNIDVASVKTDSEKLDGHLKSGDFFDAEKFPKAMFKTTSIAAAKDTTKGTHTITGDLTLHGVTKTISFPAKIEAGAEGIALNSEFSINRKDFGIVYPGMPDDLIRDGVVIKLDFKVPTHG